MEAATSEFLTMTRLCVMLVSPGEMKGEVYPFGIVGMANKGDCLQKGETVKFQLCVLGQNGQTMACNITPFRRATVECVKDQVRGLLEMQAMSLLFV